MKKGKVRGDVLRGYLKYIKRTWGKEGIDSFDSYSGIESERLKDKIWYDSDILKDVHHWLADKGEKHVELAAGYTIRNLGLLSYLVKFLNVKTLLDKAPKNFSEGFSYGDCIVEIKDKSAIVKFKDIMIDEYVCDAWKGVLKGILKATNTKGKIKPLNTPDKGDKDCFYKMEWE